LHITTLPIAAQNCENQAEFDCWFFVRNDSIEAATFVSSSALPFRFSFWHRVRHHLTTHIQDHRQILLRFKVLSQQIPPCFEKVLSPTTKMPSPLEVNEPYPEIDEVVEPLTEWEKFDTISGVDHGADEELEDALQADIMKNENEREREEEIESSEETETSGYYKKFAKDTSSGDGTKSTPLEDMTSSIEEY